MPSTVRLFQSTTRLAGNATRGFHTSRMRLSGPHYPEGPLHNIPWTPKGKWNVRIKLFSFYGLGFSLPVIAAWWQLHKNGKHFGDPPEALG